MVVLCQDEMFVNVSKYTFRVTLKVSSLKAWTKFNLTIPVSEIRFPVTTLPWELHTLIGNVRLEIIASKSFIIKQIHASIIYYKLI